MWGQVPQKAKVSGATVRRSFTTVQWALTQVGEAPSQGIWGMQVAMRSARKRYPAEASGELGFLVDKEECICTLHKMSEGKAAFSLVMH